MRQLADFKFHIDLHRHRVVRLGLSLAKAKFPNIRIHVLEGFLRLHDSSKAMTQNEQLAPFGYSSSRPPIERLFDYFGYAKISEEQKRGLFTVITDINSIDDQIGKSFLGNFNLSAREIQQMYDIEKVADLVDRSMDPLAEEEFGHHLVLASKY
ncbi:MAG: hypothetical protein EOP06_10285, partial [Proteobacteria bacterium]